MKNLISIMLVLTACILVLPADGMSEKKSGGAPDIIIAPPPAPLESFSLPEISMATGDEEPHFMKMKIAFGFETNPLLKNELKTRMEQIKHIVHIILRGKNYADLNSVEGMINLAEEIKAHVNIILTSGKIKEVYFMEFIIN